MTERSEVFAPDGTAVRFTVSIGVASQLATTHTTSWTASTLRCTLRSGPGATKSSWHPKSDSPPALTGTTVQWKARKARTPTN